MVPLDFPEVGMGCPFCGRIRVRSRGSRTGDHNSGSRCWVCAANCSNSSISMDNTGALCAETAVYCSQCSCRAREVFHIGESFSSCPDCFQAVTWKLLTVFRSSEQDEEPQSATFASRSLLLVEGEDAIAAAVEYWLSSEHLEVVRARSCAAACELASKRRFLTAALNVRPPGGSGIELASRLLHLQRVGSVVFLGGFATSLMERIQAIALGPIVTAETSPEALLEVLASVPASQRLRSSLG